jgi:c(7)-type cytochrome triheme protein
MATGDANAVPRPSMSTCQGSCHNGAAGQAFSAVGTQCTKCHKSGGGMTVALPRDQTFSHAKHVGRNVKIDGQCQSCHSIKDDGTSRVEPPNLNKNHMPCAASGCHQTEFMSKSVKICSVCHDKANPWEKTIARLQDKPNGEFFENMNHASHLARKGATNSACSDCHGDKLGGGKAPKDHEACGECHGKGPPAHPMTDCDKCHTRNAVTRAGASQWSVSATFVHQKHAQDPRSRKTTNCVECHAEIAKAKSLADVAKPKMQTCDGCHNGKLSFKATGFECSKCHTPAKQPSTPAALGSFTSRADDQAVVERPIRGELR